MFEFRKRTEMRLRDLDSRCEKNYEATNHLIKRINQLERILEHSKDGEVGFYLDTFLEPGPGHYFPFISRQVRQSKLYIYIGKKEIGPIYLKEFSGIDVDVDSAKMIEPKNSGDLVCFYVTSSDNVRHKFIINYKEESYLHSIVPVKADESNAKKK